MLTSIHMIYNTIFVVSAEFSFNGRIMDIIYGFLSDSRLLSAFQAWHEIPSTDDVI